MKRTAQLHLSRVQAGNLNFALGFTAATMQQEKRGDYIALANDVSGVPVNGLIECTPEHLALMETSLEITTRHFTAGGSVALPFEDLWKHIQGETKHETAAMGAKGIHSG
jgi:hypothetical protein